MTEISILVPTRSRPDRLLEFLQSVADMTSHLNDVEVVLGIDEDDRSYDHLESPHPELRIVKTIAPQMSMGGLNTRCLDHASGKLILLGNDDLVIRTKQWDQIIIESSRGYPDGVFLMFAKDGIKNGAFPCFPILSRAFCSLIRDPFPRAYQGDGIDMHLFDLFLRLKDFGLNRLVYLPQIYMEHRHISNGKALKDLTYNLRSHRLGNHNFYTLWKIREGAVQQILNHLKSSQTDSVADDTSSSKDKAIGILLITNCFLNSKQSISYRLRYLLYHTAREAYFFLRLHRLKRFAYATWNQLCSSDLKCKAGSALKSPD